MNNETELFSLMGGTFGILLDVAILIFSIVVNWKFFEKLGEPGWKSIIPIYNSYILCKYFFGNGLAFIAFLIPIVNVIAFIMICSKIAKAFSKGTGFAIGIFFLPIIFIAIIAFDDSEYNLNNL